MKIEPALAKRPSWASNSIAFATSDFRIAPAIFSSSLTENSRPRTDADCTIGANCGNRLSRDWIINCSGAGTSPSDTSRSVRLSGPAGYFQCIAGDLLQYKRHTFAPVDDATYGFVG